MKAWYLIWAILFGIASLGLFASGIGWFIFPGADITENSRSFDMGVMWLLGVGFLLFLGAMTGLVSLTCWSIVFPKATSLRKVVDETWEQI